MKYGPVPAYCKWLYSANPLVSVQGTRLARGNAHTPAVRLGQPFRYAGPAGTYWAHSAGVMEPPMRAHSCASGSVR